MKKITWYLAVGFLGLCILAIMAAGFYKAYERHELIPFTLWVCFCLALIRVIWNSEF